MQTPASAGNTMAGRIIRALDRVEAALATLAFGALAAVIFADVLAREFTGTGLQWARQAGVYANIVVVMLGIGVASSRGAHLRPRFADGCVPPRWEAVVEAMREAVMAGFCLIFAGLAVKVTLDAWLLQERSTLIGIVVWPLMAAMPLAFALAALRHGIYALRPGLRPVDPLSRAATEEPSAVEQA